MTCPMKLLLFLTKAGFENTTTLCAESLARCKAMNWVYPGSKSRFRMEKLARSGKLLLVAWK